MKVIELKIVCTQIGTDPRTGRLVCALSIDGEPDIQLGVDDSIGVTKEAEEARWQRRAE